MLVPMKHLNTQRQREHSFKNHRIKEISWSWSQQGLTVHFISKAQRKGLSVDNAHP